MPEGYSPLEHTLNFQAEVNIILATATMQKVLSGEDEKFHIC